VRGLLLAVRGLLGRLLLLAPTALGLGLARRWLLLALRGLLLALGRLLTPTALSGLALLAVRRWLLALRGLLAPTYTPHTTHDTHA
jgi:hypothetical protein